MPLRHSLLAASVALLWGLNFVAIDIGLETFPPLLFVALRFALTAFPAVLVTRTPGVGAKWVIAVGLFLGVGQFGLLFVGIYAGMPAGLSSLVLQLQAVFTIALAVAFLGERPTRTQLAGATVAFVGLALIASGRAESVPLIAVLLVVGAAGSWGLANICTRLAKPGDAFALLVWSSLVGPAPLAALSLAFEEPAPRPRRWPIWAGPECCRSSTSSSSPRCSAGAAGRGSWHGIPPRASRRSLCWRPSPHSSPPGPSAGRSRPRPPSPGAC